MAFTKEQASRGGKEASRRVWERYRRAKQIEEGTVHAEGLESSSSSVPIEQASRALAIPTIPGRVSRLAREREQARASLPGVWLPRGKGWKRASKPPTDADE